MAVLCEGRSTEHRLGHVRGWHSRGAAHVGQCVHAYVYNFSPARDNAWTWSSSCAGCSCVAPLDGRQRSELNCMDPGSIHSPVQPLADGWHVAHEKNHNRVMLDPPRMQFIPCTITLECRKLTDSWYHLERMMFCLKLKFFCGEFYMNSCELKACLVAPQNAKIFKIPRHIESLDACMKH